ncbi:MULTISPECIES: VOC family protein [unclassified Enterococcus]|uniref:VOC family protein n=1 Tax=unclassified Enterococcus TaxID=2608891 RepID=UPI0015569003|nr:MULTISPECIES: VOC family protein [unclassified Enterococcus]MBS7577002.1 VOC family protein [Enterococcus sp. MMGLQ5-2]MBS7584551.1 VOC family protein [Enterococcus sp. MMGLQ5-1]NPD12406.1 VOC family protein [Enterococcus sp. MMGLQ5-1]NPD36836.1 VOC family protein [Enterococcus sp. MMGLQ5-2]
MSVVIPKFQISAATQLGHLSLKVADLEEQTKFYTEVIGLELLNQTNLTSILGVDKQILLVLKKISNPLPITKKTGLFHVAFLLPSRNDLGNALIHYLTNKAPLIGASDHGYSEALYLNDPEGNGIEIYCDKDRKFWDIRPDGEIVGITVELDGDNLIESADGKWQGFPKGSKIGHVHLKVADLQETELFYTRVLGLDLKTNYGDQAKFFAAGDYHHHIGSNIWLGRHTPAMVANDLGLDYYTFSVVNAQELTRLEQHWQAISANYLKETFDSLSILDPNGIKIKIQIEKNGLDA